METKEKAVVRSRRRSIDDPPFMSPLKMNLVLCGSDGALKASISDLILGQRELSPESSSVCVRREGEVCGHLITLVEMPALYNTQLSEEEVMQETLRCVSLCDPGVHAFLFIIPEGQFTDEDKGEMEKIQRIFSSRLNNHIIILIATETRQEAMELDKVLRTVIETCRGGHYFLGLDSDVSGLIDRVRQLLLMNNGDLFTPLMYLDAQVEIQRRYRSQITELKTAIHTLERKIQGHSEGASGDSLRIVLLGKTGCGKSATGNTILGREDAFRHYPSCVCRKETTEINGRQITVIDTPGLLDTQAGNMEIQHKITKCFSMAAPGPHVFLLVLRIGHRFREEEKEALKTVQDIFGEKSVAYTIVLFSRGDILGSMSIEEYLDRPGCDFMRVIEQCGNRYHVFNNKETRDRSQVTALLEKVDSMVAVNGGSCYTNEMFHQIQKENIDQVRILKKRVEDTLREKEELKAKYEVKIKQMKKTFQEEIKTREEEFEREQQLLREMVEKYKLAGVKRAEQYEKRRKDDETIFAEKEAAIFSQMERLRSELERQRHADQIKIELEDTERREREEQERREWEEKYRKEREEYMFKIEELKRKVQSDEKRRAEEEKKRSDLEERMKLLKEKHLKELEELKHQLKELQIRIQEEVKTREMIIEKHWQEIERMKKCTEEDRLEQEMKRKKIEDKFKEKKHHLIQKMEEMEKIISAFKKEKAILTSVPERRPPQLTPANSEKDHLERRIVLLGKTGVGKSATGNTILRKNRFRSQFSHTTVTSQCEIGQAEVAGRNVCVVDTPGLFDTARPADDLTVEIRRSIFLSSPGPHVFLYVLPIVRFTEQDEHVFLKFKMMFGEEMRKYTIFLFTHGEILQGRSLEPEIQRNRTLRRLVEQCGGGYHVFNNEDGGNREQVTELLEKIDRMVKQNEQSCYSIQKFQDSTCSSERNKGCRIM